MSDHLRPSEASEVRELVLWAAAEECSLEVIGHGTKRELGRPVQASRVLSLSELKGVTLYEPEELVLSARAGTPLEEVGKLLEEHNQELAFDPIDTGSLFGSDSGRGTIGSVLACNLSGSRRIKAGAARDHVLGIEAVSGRGEIFKSGGRVVKNVTGYDLSRGLCGTWGTLSVVTDITFKVFPKPESESTLAISGLESVSAVRAMSMSLGSSAEVSCASHIPDGMAGKFGAESVNGSGKSLTLLRLEGFKPSVDYRFDKLRKLLTDFGSIDRIDSKESKSIWKFVRDAEQVGFDGRSVVWKVSVAPTHSCRVLDRLREFEDMSYFLDWGGGLIWLEFQSGQIRGEAVRGAVSEVGGHSTLMRAPVPERTSVPVFQPQPPALASLTRRLKEQFDPHGILNPGKMYAGV